MIGASSSCRSRHQYKKVNMAKIIDLAQHISTGANTEHCRLVLQTWFEKETFRLN